MSQNYFQLDDEELSEQKDWKHRAYDGIKKTLTNKYNLFLIGGAIAAHQLGIIYNGYDGFSQYDTLTHLLSAFTIGKCSADFLDETGHSNKKKYVLPVVLAAGALWEGFEYFTGVSKSLGDSNMSFMDAMKNTAKDFANDALGAELATGGINLNKAYYNGLNFLSKIDTMKYNLFGF